jgi:hypothetical protein
MHATVWAGTEKKQLGIRVGTGNRSRQFNREWREVVIEIDGRAFSFDLSPGFWKDCPEFRDDRDAPIREWLDRRGLLDWPKGRPPKLTLEPLGGNRFRLVE